MEKKRFVSTWAIINRFYVINNVFFPFCSSMYTMAESEFSLKNKHMKMESEFSLRNKRMKIK